MSFIDQIETLTAKDFKAAFLVLQEKMKDVHFRILETHYKSPNYDITATELCHLIDLASYHESNLRYGRLAGMFCKFFHIKPTTLLYIFVEFEKRNDEWHWILRPAVVQALSELKWFDEIDDYVQYHNSKENDVTCLELTYEHGFKISTSKSVSKLQGNRIWLIGGLGENPRKYYLCNHFIVDKVRPIQGPSRFKYFVTGERGVAFEPPILLNNLDWFNDFLKSQQNFSFGLRKIDKKYLVEFERLSDTNELPPEIEKPVRKTGGGFGNPETNKKVEEAAIGLVKKQYEKNGWTVQSVEQIHIGFDLLCTKKSLEEHVEVKGIQGETVSFIVTSGEVKQAKIDKCFVLCVVTSALSDNHQLNWYSSKDFNSEFRFEPLSFRASLKD